MTAKKSAKKSTKKSARKSRPKAAKRKASKPKAKSTLVAKVPSMPKARKGYLRYVDGNEVREVKARRGGTKGAKRKCG